MFRDISDNLRREKKEVNVDGKMSASSSVKIYKVGVAFAFISLLICAAVLQIKYKNNSKALPVANERVTKISDAPKSAGEDDVWERYTDPLIGFSISYPGLLIKRVRLDEEGYLSFVRFEENSFSEGTRQKGVAIGITERSREEEILKIKSEMTELGGDPVYETELPLFGTTAQRLDYEPKDETLAERRSFLIFSLEGKTYSISTVPEQLERVKLGFQILE